MIHHIVMWKLKAFADNRNKNENAVLIKQRLEGLKTMIPEIAKIEVGINLDYSAYANFDLVLDSWFDNYAAMEVYQLHPLHMEVSEWIGTVRESRAAVDYEV